MDNSTILIVISALSAFSALCSAFVAFLTFTLNKKQSAFSKKTYEEQYEFSKKTYEEQNLLLKRREVISIWKYISKLTDIDPQDPNPIHVLTNVNTLELVALCCEGGMIDKDVIYRTFLNTYIKYYEDISQIKEVSLGNKTMSGLDLIKENKSMESFYNELNKHRIETGKLKNG